MRRERTIHFRSSLLETLIDPKLFELPQELAIHDAWLSDERCFDPFRQRLTATRGRLTIPVEVYLRVMVLKHR